MTDSKPTDLAKFRRKKRTEKGRETTMCKRGFHKWTDDERKQFDVKQGKLISRQRCTRCGTTRTSSS